jgi:aminopeptidase
MTWRPLPLTEVLYPMLIDEGFNVLQRLTITESMEQSFYRISDPGQLTFKVPGDAELFSALNGSISLRAPSSITHLSSVDPDKIGKAMVSRKYLSDILDVREAQGQFGWTLCMYPTDELARHAGMGREEYEDQIIKACFLGRKDPVTQWKEIYKDAQAIKKWLNSMKVKFFHIESDGIDLEIFPGEYRKWIGVSGHNIPSFELFLSPDWRGTNGIYYADQPSYRSGNLHPRHSPRVQERLGRERGRRGGPRLRPEAALHGRGRQQDRGVLAHGQALLQDRQVHGQHPVRRNFGGRNGNCHIAVGASYSDTYDGNPAELTKEKKARLGFNDSALHWDLVNTQDKRVVAFLDTGEKKTIYEKGMFTY